MGRSSGYVETTSFKMDVNIPLTEQNDGNPSIVHTATTSGLFTMCFTYRGTDGTDFIDAKGGYGCSDALFGLFTTSTCKFAGDNTLNVSLGSIKRSDIQPYPAKMYPISAIAELVCVGDASLAVVSTFIYTPLDGDSAGVVATSIPGLGVAVKYNGDMINNVGRAETFTTGTNTLSFEFAPVKSTQTSQNIRTGDFTSDIVMIITLQ